MDTPGWDAWAVADRSEGGESGHKRKDSCAAAQSVKGVLIVDKVILELNVIKIEYYYNVYGANAINFLTTDGYFSIQRCVYIDSKEDPQLNDPFWELNSQAGADSRPFVEIFFGLHCVAITPEGRFLDKFDCVKINLANAMDMELVDFFVNYLYSGNCVKYGDDLTSELRIKQSIFPDVI